MTDLEAISKIMSANVASNVLVGDWKKEYLRLCKLIHPDTCKHVDASKAMTKLNEFKEYLENGAQYADESGEFRAFDDRLEYNITDDNKKLLYKSIENYRKLTSINTDSSKYFRNYFPKNMEIVGDKLIITFRERSLPLTNKQLPQVHVNWIFSRLFEVNLWLGQEGYSHMGINPTSVFVVPETHGVVITSFYHMVPIGSKAKTISAKYKMWYPTTLFSKKIATPDIDLELVKKIAIYLLGDKSAAGTKLKRDANINQDILSYLLTKHQNNIDDFIKYRDILMKNFEKKFYVLDI